MKSIFRLLVFVLLVAGWSLAALSLHVVRAKDDRVVLIPKQKLSITDTYADARTWTLEEAAKHPALVRRIIESGKAGVFAYIVSEDEKADASDVAEALDDALKNAPKSESRNGKSISAHAKAATAWWNLGG